MQTPCPSGQDRHEQGQHNDQFQNIVTVFRIRHIVIVMAEAEDGLGGRFRVGSTSRPLSA